MGFDDFATAGGVIWWVHPALLDNKFDALDIFLHVISVEAGRLRIGGTIDNDISRNIYQGTDL